MKTSKFLLTLIILFLTFNQSYSYYDLTLSSNVNCIVTIKITSAPFEGLNRYTTNPYGNNRVHSIQNGFIHRRYTYDPQYADSQIIYSSRQIVGSEEVSYLRMSSCYSETVTCPVYGFNKYLITFYNIYHPERTINFYYNTLDSKLGCDTVFNELFTRILSGLFSLCRILDCRVQMFQQLQ